MGQNSQNLKQRYQEYIRYIKHNKPQLAYALHVLNMNMDLLITLCPYSSK